MAERTFKVEEVSDIVLTVLQLHEKYFINVLRNKKTKRLCSQPSSIS